MISQKWRACKVKYKLFRTGINDDINNNNMLFIVFYILNVLFLHY